MDFKCTLWDTVGNDDLHNAFLPPTRQAHQVRSISYKSTEIFCICFSIDNWESLDNVVQKVRGLSCSPFLLPPCAKPGQWLPEIEPSIREWNPVCLLGLKQDLRYDPETILKLGEQGRAPITRAEVSKATSIFIGHSLSYTLAKLFHY